MSSSSIKIKDIFLDHWDAFVLEGYPLRSAVLKNVDKVIKCGDPSMGYALYHCENCSKFKYVYFTCKSRFCNPCAAKYIQDRASKISSKLINCKHRHIVFTIPEELRIFFRRDRKLLNLLFKASSDTVLSWFYKINKSENFKPGIISTMHTFGRDLKWNPHIHMIVTEGASGNKTVWRKISHIPFNMLRKRWQATILDFLHKYLGNSFYSLKSRLFKTYSDDFMFMLNLIWIQRLRMLLNILFAIPVALLWLNLGFLIMMVNLLLFTTIAMKIINGLLRKYMLLILLSV